MLEILLSGISKSERDGDRRTVLESFKMELEVKISKKCSAIRWRYFCVTIREEEVK